MQKIKKFVILLSILFMPVVSLAENFVLIPCKGADCDFNGLMALINNVIHFVLFYMAVPIAAIMFFYAGFMMVTSAGSSESKTKAKNIFSSAVYGLVIVAAAWLIVRTILSILGYEGAWIFNNFK
ncbi:hypothetical protein A2456_01685 [Candidatus Nomurabacteria bacterium RIFOXYC2_FULL_36_19]|uniref:TrbC/VIRB2 family protein n=2 Tax=Candidatus Nomuraibacteriota TaxID=1752729 RepID=A0A1F6YUA2_9BACT|nr:MAG: hypothetical protein UR91_C0033G0005 [Candidatus Nomurabacteria bacterium GW2011_GWC2_35_8]OGJ05815.1 MAG: hypothetical protein A2238_01915 [Candidatus Nomurabacteria bacterium RIFOXYA2_FULL_35_9]OGJ09954.1 MAG: hypothetical protein A2456_01685 [Candidatus Nomurabacteria bacterium RIFOXYC2_FULL_36_19]OGJ15200.1 MAG: hypothetical protein A2554_03205 [Candidatus Nomurabacteria bacterium RIFOXYD2_FULL_35_12]